MRASASDKVRLTIRIHPGLKAALEALQKTKREKHFTEKSLADLLTEGALLLLDREGVSSNGLQPEPSPKQKKPRRRGAGKAS